MSKRRTYIKIECADCGRNVSRNTYAVHLSKCKPFQERKERDRIEKLKTIPIAEMTLGQLLESGRVEEFKAWSK